MGIIGRFINSREYFLEFLQKYQLLFFVAIPLWITTGMVFRPLNFLFVAVYCIYFYLKDRPDYILLGFLVLLVMGDSRQPIFLFSKPLRTEFFAIMAMFSLNDIRKGVYNLNTKFFYFLPFFAFSFISLLNSPDVTTGFLKSISFIFLIFNGFHFIYNIFDRFGKAMLHDVLMWVVIVLLAGLLLAPISPEFCFYLGSFRYNGLLGNPNGMGIFIALLFPMFVYLFESHGGYTKGFKRFVFFLLTISLLLCSSRNAMISVSIFLTAYYGLKGTLYRRIILFLGVFPIMLITIYSVDLEQMIINFGLDSYFRLKDFESGSGRIYAWDYALEIVEENPLMGCGFYCEEYKFRYEPSFFLWTTGHQGGVHNSFLAFLVNVGAIGLGLFLISWASVLSHIKKLKFLLPYLAGVLVSAVFESWLIASMNAFHILFVLMVVTLLTDQKYNIFRLE